MTTRYFEVCGSLFIATRFRWKGVDKIRYITGSGPLAREWIATIVGGDSKMATFENYSKSITVVCPSIVSQVFYSVKLPQPTRFGR